MLDFRDGVDSHLIAAAAKSGLKGAAEALPLVFVDKDSVVFSCIATLARLEAMKLSVLSSLMAEECLLPRDVKEIELKVGRCVVMTHLASEAVSFDKVERIYEKYIHNNVM